MPSTTSPFEATGLFIVHVNRVLQELRAARVIRLKDRMLAIPDLAALHEAGLFDGADLHADRGAGTWTRRNKLARPGGGEVSPPPIRSIPP